MKSRLIAVTVFATLWALAISVRLYSLQVVHHEEYARKAERQQQRVVRIDPPRGTIYDARGRELAVSVEVDSLFAVPRDVVDREATAKALAPVLGLKRKQLMESLEGDGEFSWIVRKLDPPVAAAVRALELPGLHFLKEYKRYYPMGSLAGPVLGFVGLDNQGLAGLEVQYDSRISGRSGERTVLRDARRSTTAPPTLPSAAAQEGEDLYLTLDASIQHLAESALEQAVQHHRARSGSMVILDPRTGAVLAMASVPRFDPNHFSAFTAAQRRNRPVQDAFEPGSTFKLVTFAAALEANLIDPGDEVDCELGGITVAGSRIRDHHPFGRLTFRQVLAKSSNVGTIKVSQRMEPKNFYEAIRAFGFGRAAGIDLPGEHPGLLRPQVQWTAAEPAYISFGQGIGVTALQMANAVAAVANGGKLFQPYLVQAVGRGGQRIPVEGLPKLLGRPVSSSTALQLERMMEGVVAPGGTGKAAAISGFTVAGKTGTAQLAEPGEGYSPDRRVPSFVGFAPARDPRLVALVVLDTPRAGLTGGGAVAAPVFGEVIHRALLYLGVPPDAKKEVPTVVAWTALGIAVGGRGSHPDPGREEGACAWWS